MEELQDEITNLTSNEEGAFLNFEGVGTPDYIVDNNNLLGYIDLESLELITNEYASVLSDNLYLD